MENFDTVRERSQIPQEDKWAIEDLYISDAAWEEDLVLLEKDKEILLSYVGKLGTSGDILYDYL